MSIEEKIIFQSRPRSRRLTIRITPSAILVTYPRWVSKKVAEQFVEERKEWIAKQVHKLASHTLLLPVRLTASEIMRAKIQARQVVLRKLLQFNERYHFTYTSVSIRSQRTRWGSCSKRSHLSFNYKLIFLPEELQNYIIVHELCHLKELNHSKQFWKLVAHTIPHFKELRYKLKKFHL